jgi:hypothetical protein
LVYGKNHLYSVFLEQSTVKDSKVKDMNGISTVWRNKPDTIKLKCTGY